MVGRRWLIPCLRPTSVIDWYFKLEAEIGVRFKFHFLVFSRYNMSSSAFVSKPQLDCLAVCQPANYILLGLV
jgi:hypothetical protein